MLAEFGDAGQHDGHNQFGGDQLTDGEPLLDDQIAAGTQQGGSAKGLQGDGADVLPEQHQEMLRAVFEVAGGEGIRPVHRVGLATGTLEGGGMPSQFPKPGGHGVFGLRLSDGRLQSPRTQRHQNHHDGHHQHEVEAQQNGVVGGHHGQAHRRLNQDR